MNCKPGDLAMVVRCDNHIASRSLLGCVVTVHQLSTVYNWRDCWEHDGPKPMVDAYQQVTLPDRWLMPIRGDINEDETPTEIILELTA